MMSAKRILHINQVMRNIRQFSVHIFLHVWKLVAIHNCQWFLSKNNSDIEIYNENKCYLTQHLVHRIVPLTT